jgi:hypothetical protein
LGRKMFDIRGANPPAIALILAAAFIWWGFMNNSLTAMTVGGVFAAIGVGLQVLYLRYRYGRAMKARAVARYKVES